MRKVISSMLLILLLLALLNGCLKQETPREATIELIKEEETTAKPITLHILTNRVDLIDNGGFALYAQQFEQVHPNVKLSFEGLTNYVSDISARLSTQDYGDVLLIPNHMKN